MYLANYNKIYNDYMKIPKFLKIIMGFLVCIAFIRFINGAEPLSTYDLMLKIQQTDFTIIDYEDLSALLDHLEKYNEQNLNKWNNNLTGIDGFLENLKNVFIYGSINFLEGITLILTGFLHVIKNVIKNILKLIELAFYICGFNT